eukprot:TRINITY_DN33371_c0_g1_i1.p3 TRINITY_DN33371_c0_g1~~TRINITY_DN33371_c0_g1_i1.p3  ORF type:complete len:134 (-),score=37.03 TRINITY_DN33371_c0_g1_i1:411-785(-)
MAEGQHTALFERNQTFTSTFLQGKDMAAIAPILAEGVVYTFSHSHLIGSDVHSHTHTGKEEVLGQLRKTATDWSNVKLKGTEVLSATQVQNTLGYSRFFKGFECVEKLTFGPDLTITHIDRSRT